MTAALLVLALAGQPPAPPSTQQIQEWFEAGQYDQVITNAQNRTEPRIVYLAGFAHLRLSQLDLARQRFESLAARDVADVWAHVGRSAVLLNAPATNELGVVTPEAEAAAVDQAIASARQAVETNPGLAIAHYQLGLAHSRKSEHAAAAAAFDQAVAIDPRLAYAYYYGALSHYEIQQTTQMANGFEYFVRVAPNAPERGQVESIMRTLRGR